MLGVSQELVVTLCGGVLFPEFLMAFIKVDCKFSGMSRCEVMFQVYGDVWMIAFVGEEWRNSSSGAQSIVVGKLC